jgi:nitrogen fixation protein NifB
LVRKDKKTMAIIQFPKNGPITLTLPVAERSLARIRFDPIEKQARAVLPEGACNWVDEQIRKGVKVTAVNIEGPGDPLADIDKTMATLRLFRHKYPDIALGLTTLGIHGEKYAGKLRKAGVQNVTLLIDAIDRRIADKLYAWIRPAQKTIPLEQATTILMAEQQAAIKTFLKAGCSVAIRSTVYPGFNDAHIETIAEAMAGCGAQAMILKGYQPAADEEEPLLVSPGCELMQRLLSKAVRHLPTTLAPANDTLNPCQDPAAASAVLPRPTKTRPNVAVVSSNGMEVDLHLGQAYQALIYGPREDGFPCLLATRPVPEPGGGSNRWQEFGGTLEDCFALLAASAGESPRSILAERGIAVLICDSDIAATVDKLYGGGKKGKLRKR